MSAAPYYAVPLSDGPTVLKSWHRGPGFARDFRGWAVVVDGREVALYERCTDAYADLARRWFP
jgi:hypothetical protein